MKSPPMQGHTRTIACLSTVDNWGHGAPGGHRGELVAEPWKTLIIDQGSGASKGTWRKSQYGFVWVKKQIHPPPHLAFFWKDLWPNLWAC